MKKYCENIIECEDAYQDEIREAQDLFKMFHDKYADKHILIEMNWAKKQGLLGRVSAIGYRSNKWEDDEGSYNDYIHTHKRPLPRLIRKYTNGDMSIKTPILEADPPVYAFLGNVLDIEFYPCDKNGKFDENIPYKIDYMKDGDLPYLLLDRTRRLLIIQPKDSSSLLLIQSPILTVTRRGIEN
jgi:hypothetical protein